MRTRLVQLGGLVALTLALTTAAVANTTLADFSAASVGSYNPRAGWQAFGAGTTDAGIRADGSVGNGAYHAIDWASSTWGIGDIATASMDLSSYTAVTVDARLVDLGSLTGTAKIAFAIDQPGGVEYSTPDQALAISSTYTTYTFTFSTLALSAGGGALNLANATPKFIVRKNGQSGAARFDFDQIIAVGGGGGPPTLTPVVLRPPWDGDNYRAMWVYDSSGAKIVNNVSTAQALLDFCAREGVNVLYFYTRAIIEGGSAAMQTKLRDLLRVAHASGIRVEALYDAVHVPAASEVEGWCSALLAFHQATPADVADDFDAVHLDVEFWLNSPWSDVEAGNQVVARTFLDDVLVSARAYLDEHGGTLVDLGCDLSTHFDATGMLPSPLLYDGVTQYFLQHVLDHADSVTLMSYYDSAGALLNTTYAELDQAAAKSRRIMLGADVAPVPTEHPNNSFADNTPTPYSAMTVALQNFHGLLTTTRRGALDGFAVFHYDYYPALTPNPLNRDDLNGDGTVNFADFTIWKTYYGVPGVPAVWAARDGDYDLSGSVDLADFAHFARCYTGDNCGCPVPEGCAR
jgi:hypothetical protein